MLFVKVQKVVAADVCGNSLSGCLKHIFPNFTTSLSFTVFCNPEKSVRMPFSRLKKKKKKSHTYPPLMSKELRTAQAATVLWCLGRTLSKYLFSGETSGRWPRGAVQNCGQSEPDNHSVPRVWNTWRSLQQVKPLNTFDTCNFWGERQIQKEKSHWLRFILVMMWWWWGLHLVSSFNSEILSHILVSIHMHCDFVWSRHWQLLRRSMVATCGLSTFIGNCDHMKLFWPIQSCEAVRTRGLFGNARAAQWRGWAAAKWQNFQKGATHLRHASSSHICCHFQLMYEVSYLLGRHF